MVSIGPARERPSEPLTAKVGMLGSAKDQAALQYNVSLWASSVEPSADPDAAGGAALASMLGLGIQTSTLHSFPTYGDALGIRITPPEPVTPVTPFTIDEF